MQLLDGTRVSGARNASKADESDSSN